MIKLILNPEKGGEVKRFDKKIIIVGSEQSSADLCLTKDDLEPSHLKIEQIGNDFYIYNIANDPFATLNNSPFGKKKLASHDLIQVGRTHIQVQLESPSLQDSETLAPSENQIPTNTAYTYQKESWLSTNENQLHVMLEKKILSSSQNSEEIHIQTLEKTFCSSDPTPETAYQEFQDIENNIQEEIELLELTANENETEATTTPSFQPETTIIETASKEKTATKNEEAPSNLAAETPLIQEQLPQDPAADQIPQDTASIHEASAPLPKNKGSLKDYYLSDFDDESEVWNQHKKTLQNPPKIYSKLNWKTFGIISSILAFILISLIVAVFFYLHSKNFEEEQDAAEAVADISMALAFAQLNHIKPLNQNWSDPDFLKNNLMAVLASEYPPAPFFENHGQFKNNDYSLRIYSSTDLSQFLVIAQPTPGIFQWLVPKASIIVDSNSMEMHRTSDLKSLNRVLQNSNPLDGINAAEVSTLIKKEEIITFNSLTSHKRDLGYEYAKALAFLRPGAENRIYNTPRYYPFSETFLKKAVHITDDSVSQYERSIVQNELKQLYKFPNLVLYSTKGIKWLQRAQKAMGFLYPNNNFLYANIVLNSKGKIQDSHLIIGANGTQREGEQDIEEIAWAVEEGNKLNSIELDFSELDHEIEDLVMDEDDSKTGIEHSVDINQPLYKELVALSHTKNQSLQTFELQILKLLETSNTENLLPFLTKLQFLMKKAEAHYEHEPEKAEKNKSAITFVEALIQSLMQYEEAKNAEQLNLTEKLSKIQSEHANITHAEFIAYVKAAGFKGFNLKQINPKDSPQETEVLKTKIQALITNIQNADNLSYVEMNLNELEQVFSSNKISDLKKLMEYQNDVRLSVLRKLNDFLLSSEPSISSSDLIPENRAVVANILKTARIVDPDEFDFYLNEFDLRLQDTPH